MPKPVDNQPSPLDIVDSFTIASVATIIVIRSFLAVSGYPQLGGDGFHIAHMLWGGIALTVALLMSLLQRTANREVLALLGGVGFGFFIDEIGKFVTSDNNYFYHGSFLLMYLSLLLIWGLSRITVARSQKQLLFLPAVWPSQPLEKLLIVVWVCTQLVGLPLLSYSWTGGGIVAFLQLLCVSIYCLALLLGLAYAYFRQSARAASILRQATCLAIITVMPFLYYLNPLFALVNTLCAVLIMVGLSEVSVKQLLRRAVPWIG